MFGLQRAHAWRAVLFTTSVVVFGLAASANAQPGVLNVSPSEGFFTSGQEGGPFDPPSKDYTLENTGGEPIDWVASKSQDWVTLSKTDGTLDPSASDIVTVSINSNANSLPPGTYGDTVVFTNTTNHMGDTARVVFLTVNADTDTIHVPGDYPTIQAAIGVAQEGDTVLVADGTYTGDGNKNLDFYGKAITVRSENGPDNCIIDCEGDGRGFYFHNGETADSVVDGFTLTNGYAGDYPHRSGGGICCDDYTNPTITNCTITGNTAAECGGGIYYRYGSAPTSTDCLITSNTALEDGGGVYCAAGGGAIISNCEISSNNANDGGGVYCAGSAPTITDCLIMLNEAQAGHSDGGGISCKNYSDPLIANCIIALNHAGFAGGGVSCERSDPQITSCQIAGNTTNWYGAGVYCYDNSNPMVSKCVIAANVSQRSGGGVYCEYFCDPIIANCTIAGNMADEYGGGVYCLYSCTPDITSCRITDNVAGETGGGISCSGSFPRITDCTIAGNTATNQGGGICSTGTNPRITNCIMWGDSAAQGPEIAVVDGRLTVSYSDVEGGLGGAYVGYYGELIWGDGNINVAPLFVDPDGPDDDPDNWLDNDHHLSPGSPCIDAGCNWGVPADIADLDDDGDTTEFTPLDLDGEGRFFDDPNTPDTGWGCPPLVDMGAYEFGDTDPQPCPGDLDCDGDTDQADLGILLADWGCDDPVHGCDGDLNGDDKTDQADLGILLADWGCGCP